MNARLKLVIFLMLTVVAFRVTASEAPCSSWLGMKEKDRVYMASADISDTVGSPDVSELSKCVWNNLEAISELATNNCQTVDSNYEVAVLRAVTTWVRKCLAEK